MRKAAWSSLLLGAWVGYVSTSAARAQSCTPDAYEPDDACPSVAFGLQGGAVQSRNFCEDTDDFAAFNTCAGRVYTIETRNLGASTDTILDLLASDCTTVLATDDDSAGGGASRIVWSATSNGLLHVRAKSKGSVTGSGQTYDLALIGDTSPCSTWAKNYGTTSGEGASTIAVLENGDLLTVGTTSGGALVARLDPSGGVVWSKQVGSAGGTDSLVSAVEISGDIVLAGSTDAFPASGMDAWAVRLSGSGSIVWQKAFGVAGSDDARVVLPAPGGNVYVVGNQGGQGWVARLDGSGGVVWEKRYATLSVLSATSSSAGGILVAGSRSDPTCPTCGSAPNYTLLRLDADGVPVWQWRYPIGINQGVFMAKAAEAIDGSWFILQTTSLGSNSITYLDHISADGATGLSSVSISGLGTGPKSIARTSDGGFILGGTSPAGSFQAAWLLKLDASGSYVWQQRYGQPITPSESGRSAVEIPGGGYAFIGTTDSLRPAADGLDLFVGRTDALGGIPGAPCDLVEPTAFTPTANGAPGAVAVTPSSAANASTIVTTNATASTLPLTNGACVNYDTDGDHVPDATDNCVFDSNANQANFDGDALGDVCDPDDDNDGAPDTTDNCAFLSNPSQLDSDGDGRGDPCDACPLDGENDIDGDQLCADVDNCDRDYNPGQEDGNSNGVGDACEPSAAATWARNYGAASQERPGGIAALADGGSLIVGAVDGDGLIVRLDASGQTVWSRGFSAPGANDFLSQVLVVPGGFLLAGETDSFGSGDRDLWLVRIDDSGSILWQKAYGTSFAESIVALLPAPSGDSYLAGNTSGGGWLARIDGSGNVVWQNRYTTIGLGAVSVSAGGLILAGRATGSCGACSDADVSLLRLDAAGAPIWQFAYPVAPSTDSARGVFEAADGTFWVLTVVSVEPSTTNQLLHVDATGGVVLSRLQIPGLARSLASLFATSDGGFAFAGSTSSIAPPGAWLVKLTAQGAISWQRSYGQPVSGNDFGGPAVERPGGGYAVAGIAESLRPTSHGDDLFVIRTDANGLLPDQPCDLVNDTAATLASQSLPVPSAMTPSADAGTLATATTLATAAPSPIGRGQCVNFDSDGDGVPDATDNCVSVPNPNQVNFDGDSLGDVCDPDDDNDGAPDTTDNCAFLANPSQANADGDARGDACDPCPLDAADDVDGDGVCGNVDNCPGSFNPGQQDADHDGVGDACEGGSGTTWGRNYGGALGGSSSSIVAVSASALVVTGFFGGNDPAVIRVDAAGTPVWQRTVTTPGTSDSFITSVASGDDVVLAGSSASYGAGGNDAWVMRVDGSGNVLWQKAYGTPGEDTVRTILAAPGGGFYLIGNRATSAWVARIDDVGAVVWEKLFATLTTEQAVAAAGGGLVVVGTRSDSGCITCGNVTNFTLLRLDDSGNPVWQMRYPTGGTRFGDTSPRIAQSADGSWFVVARQFNGASTVTYLTRISGDGSTVIWRKSFFGLERGPRWIIGTSDGGLLLAGTSTPADVTRAWLAKLDAVGTIQWERKYGGTTTGTDGADVAVEVPGGGFAFAGVTDDLAPPGNPTNLLVGKVDALGHMPDSPCDLETDTSTTPGTSSAGVVAVTPTTGTTISTVTTTTAVLVTAAIANGQCVNFDGDGDGIADASDNCPTVANAGQQNADGDAFGDACDACPNDAANDADGDGRCADVDNCPTIANPAQTNSDSDGLGDACDNCPTVASADQGDPDGDKLGNPCDNCPSIFNVAQADTDADGRGNLCDICPTVSDPSQTDTDGDGRGDACDCQPQDPTDFRPAAPASLSIAKGAANAAVLTWSASSGADAYSVTRGVLADIRGGTYGDCLAQGLTSPTMTDSSATTADQSYFYLVQAQNFDCGISDLGYRSNETIRNNADPQACLGQTVTDVHASGQSTVFGTVTGTLNATLTSDDAAESIQEVLSTGGSPSTRFSRLEQRWTFTIPAGSRAELHVEGWRTVSPDGDDFVFEWATDGVTFHSIALGSLPNADPDADTTGALPALPAGTLTIRVLDTNRTAGTQALDTVSIDELFVRVVP